jgi:hypothetical protein
MNGGSGLHCPQRSDPGDFGERHHQMLPVGTHAESRAPPHEILPGATRRGIVHADVEQMDARPVLGVEPADVGQRPGRFDHDRHAMELVMAGMKHVPAQATAPAPKCLSKAFARSPAMD